MSLPREKSVMYNIIHGDEQTKNKTFRQFKFMNRYFVVPLYRIYFIPLLGIGRLILLLTTIGRKSGMKRYSPLEYHRINKIVHIFSSRGKQSDWYKNIVKTPDRVNVQTGFKKFKAKVRIIDSVDERIEVFKWYVTKHPYYAKQLFGWDKKNDKPDTETLRAIAENIEVVQLIDH